MAASQVSAYYQPNARECHRGVHERIIEVGISWSKRTVRNWMSVERRSTVFTQTNWMFPKPRSLSFPVSGFFEYTSPQAFSFVRLSPLRVSVTSRLTLFFWIYKILLDCSFSASVVQGLRAENASNTRLLLTLLLNGQAKTDLTCICDNFGKTTSMF